MDMPLAIPLVDLIALALGIAFAPMAIVAVFLSYFRLRANLPTTLA